MSALTHLPAGLLRIDGDNHNDLVAFDAEAGLSWFPGDGTGGFGPAVPMSGPWEFPWDLETADVDGDGDTDVLTATNAGLQLIRAAGGGLAPATTVVGGGMLLIELADVDGAGDLDCASADQGVTHNRLLLGDGSGHFSAAPVSRFPRLPGVPDALSFLDFETDGDADLVLAQGRVVLYRNEGGGIFTDATGALIPPGGAEYVDAGDIDRDGAPDILVGTSTGLRLLRNPGASGAVFVDRPDLVPELGGKVEQVALLDANEDGRLDALVMHEYEVLYLQGVASRGLVLRESLGSLYPLPAAADVDDDGDVDLLGGRGGGYGASLEPIRRNRTQQVAWRSRPSIGKDLVLDLFGPAGGPWVLFVSPSRAETATPFGMLWLDPAGLASAGAGSFDSRGQSSIAFPVPNDPALLGTTSYWQALVGKSPRYSNLEATQFTDL